MRRTFILHANGSKLPSDLLGLTCVRYGDATTAEVTYESMLNPFSSTGTTSHATPVTGLVDGTSYSYYVRCQNTAGNANSDDFVYQPSM